MIVFWLLIMESNGQLAQVMYQLRQLQTDQYKQKYIRTSKIKYFILNDLKNKNNKQLFI